MVKTIRLLVDKDAEQFQKIRLLSLKEDSISWLASWEEEKDLPTSTFAYRITSAYFHPIFGYWGLFYGNELIAVAYLSKSYWAKTQHIAMLYDVCVHPKYRRQSVGSELLRHIIQKAKTLKSLDAIHLYTTSRNTPAMKFYESLGFKKVATIPKSVKEKDGTYQDQYLFILHLKE
jgi:hypothetical protein